MGKFLMFEVFVEFVVFVFEFICFSVLVVDDNVVGCYVMVYVLCFGGYMVVEVVIGVEVLEKVVSLQFDLIVLDVNLLDISGFEVVWMLCQNFVFGVVFILMVLVVWVVDMDCVLGLEGGVDVYFMYFIDLVVLFVIICVLLCVCFVEVELW